MFLIYEGGEFENIEWAGGRRPMVEEWERHPEPQNREDNHHQMGM